MISLLFYLFCFLFKAILFLIRYISIAYFTAWKAPVQEIFTMIGCVYVDCPLLLYFFLSFLHWRVFCLVTASLCVQSLYSLMRVLLFHYFFLMYINGRRNVEKFRKVINYTRKFAESHYFFFSFSIMFCKLFFFRQTYRVSLRNELNARRI